MSDELEKLVSLKLPLVQRDYESCFASASRIYDRMKQLHTIEVTVVAGLIALMAKDVAFQFPGSWSGFIFISGCAYIEVVLRANLGWHSIEGQELEQKLQEQDLERFRRNIATWEFGNTRVAKRTYRARLRRMYWAIRKPDFLVWHVVLSLCLYAAIR
jgi:hypothetical protein